MSDKKETEEKVDVKPKGPGPRYVYQIQKEKKEISKKSIKRARG